MRGKGQPNTRSSVTSGITPAYAGKSRKFSRPVWVTGDHPRLCGEKRFLLIKHMFVYGSPPPMRGKGGYISPPLSRVGITPAYAGKSITKLTESAMCQDHPRLCGEKRNSLVEFVLCPGSPPPMRGKGPSDAIVACVSGITPAYAGKSELWTHERIAE